MGKIARLDGKYKTIQVNNEISDEYTYLYLCRANAATAKYLMSRMFYIYIMLLIATVTVFTSFAFIKNDTKDFLQLIIQFYPLVIPIIKNINGCSKTMKYCSKIDADIDNFFADGDDSVERLARFQYYVQNIEFEMLNAAPARYAIFPFIFKRGMRILSIGVTKRFVEAIEELKKKALLSTGGVSIRAFKKEILTKKEIDLKTLEKKFEANKRDASIIEAPAPKPQLKAPAKAAAAKSSTASKASTKSTEKKTTTKAKTTTLAPVKVIKKPTKK